MAETSVGNQPGAPEIEHYPDEDYLPEEYANPVFNHFSAQCALLCSYEQPSSNKTIDICGTGKDLLNSN